MILIVDDDYSITASLELLLKQAGHAAASVATPADALARMDDPEVQLVLQDMNFSRRTTGQEGLQLLADIKRRRPDLPVILITAWGSIELAVAGMKAGAADFITKPWRNEQVVQAVTTVLELAASGAGRLAAGLPGGGHAATGAEVPEAPGREELDERYDFSGVLGRDPAFLHVLDLAGRVAASDASVLITGESGTGKEVLAGAIHRNSRRRDGPFVKVNLGGIPGALFESEMFGHVRGAFTDARRDRVGRFALADGGTILLDEIGEVDPHSQVKLLRVLQDRTYEALGSSRPRTLDVRVISATNRDLPDAVENGRFREDLYYRLNLITLRLPSLAERPGDIPLLAGRFLAQAAQLYGRDGPPPMITADALRWLRTQAWPGNVRQLKHFIERAVLTLRGSRLDASACEQVQRMEAADGERTALPSIGAMTLDEVEKAMIEKSLRHHEGNISRAAESLGLSRAAFYRRLEKYGISA